MSKPIVQISAPYFNSVTSDTDTALRDTRASQSTVTSDTSSTAELVSPSLNTAATDSNDIAAEANSSVAQSDDNSNNMVNKPQVSITTYSDTNQPGPNSEPSSLQASTSISVIPHVELVTDSKSAEPTVATTSDSVTPVGTENVTTTLPEMESPPVGTEVVVKSSPPDQDQTIAEPQIDPVPSTTVAASEHRAEAVIESAEITSSAIPVTSPASPAKKKSFWSKLSRIFKPWKWRRKKKSKKFEQNATGESSWILFLS